MLKKTLSLVAVCLLVVAANAQTQESEVTQVTTRTSGGEDLLNPLWNMDDATPQDTGTVDLRFGFRWVTESAPANLGDSDDDFVFSPTLVWGAAENLELSLTWDAWLGDSGDMGPFDDGNYDTTLGVLWRIHEQVNEPTRHGFVRLPSIALAGKARIPTGCTSSGVDGELRLILTNHYDSGVRSHLNLFGKAIDGDNEETANRNGDFDWVLIDNDGELDPRDFQWGVVLGADGPLCGDGAVRWVADYMHRSSEFHGRGDMDILELGWEWTMSEMHKLGMSMQIGLDHTDDNPNFGVGLMYALTLGA